MFTGIIEEVGKVRSIKKGANSAVISIDARTVLSDVHIGDSIAVNGVCLTVVSYDKSGFSADVMHETLNRSSLGNLRSGSPVNLERAMAAGGRFGGHIVSGHIDGTGKIVNIKQDDNAYWYTISADAGILRYIIEKGSITIDGISLTVAYIDNSVFRVSIIPHTRANTNLGTKSAGDVVNLENDLIGKYVEKLFPGNSLWGGETKQAPETSLSRNRREEGISKEFLLKNGF